MLEIISNMVELCSSTIIIYCIFKHLLYFETEVLSKYILWIFGTELVLIMMCSFDVNKLVIVVYVLCVPICINILLLIQKKISRIVYALFAILLIGGMENIMLRIISILFNLLNWNINKQIGQILTMIIVTLTWIVISRFVDNRYVNRLRRVQSHFFVFISIVSCLNQIIYQFAMDCVYDTDFGTYKNETAMEWSLLFSGIVLLGEIIYIICLYFEKTHYTIENDFTKEYLEIEKRHFKEMQQRDEDTRRFRHDIKNHLAVLNSFASENKYDKLEAYLKQLDSSFASTQMLYQTGNEVVDGILSQKKPILEEYHIELDMDGSLKKIDYIDDFDFCTIFSNALQNAIEACMKVPENVGKRKIAIQYTAKNNICVLKFENTVKETLVIKNNQIKTSKKDKRNHGFGLKQIEKVAKDYGGDITLKSENNTFTMIVTLKNRR